MEHASRLDQKSRTAQAADIRCLAARIWLTKGICAAAQARTGAVLRTPLLASHTPHEADPTESGTPFFAHRYVKANGVLDRAAGNFHRRCG